jgi:NAD(P)-dependent dehydrogenase (short-subunit alcohol dehydrogenase family)
VTRPDGARGAAVVTGGGRGVGRAIALELASVGFAVAVLARSAGELDETAAAIREHGGRAFAVACDVRDLDEVSAAVDAAERELGALTALVNNAGTGAALGPLWEVEPEAWWTDVETTLRGAFNACRAVVPRLLERRAGRIVNVTSYVAVRPSPYQTGYAAGKAALLSLSESLAASLAPHGIQVFAFTPGYVETELTRWIREAPAGRRWLPDVGSGGVVPVEQGARMVAALVSGRADRLSGRFLHALDDLDDVLRRADEVDAGDYYAPRLRRLPPVPPG